MKLLKPKKFKIKKIIKDQKTIRVIEKGEKFDFFFPEELHN
jgi:predicted transcriptional regulator